MKNKSPRSLGLAVGFGVMTFAGCQKPAVDAPTSQPANAAKPPPGANAIRNKTVGLRPLQSRLELVGSVAYDPDHIALVGPLVAGRMAMLAAKSGTPVKKMQLLAEVESPEAGQAMAQYITAAARKHAALAQLARERELGQKHISSARDLEVAEAQATQVHAELRAAEELLQALGIEPQNIRPSQRGRVPLRSPIDGVVVNRFVTLGQAVERGTDAFYVADLSHLWVELEIYEKDLNHVYVGQAVELRTESLPGRTFAAKVAFLEPTVDVKTRTTNMRLELINTDHLLRPGQFVTAHMGPSNDDQNAMVLAVERSALQTLDGHDVVFVQTGDHHEARVVTLGQCDDQFVEITSGITLGESVAVEGAFLLKARQTLR
jgi:cobalt-zinc-cadmium efflux system membrane fusion protein